jgi:cyclopropane fatty-acyl-phospholipid synthase-like methyltransferase
MPNTKEIVDYYEMCEIDYQRFWNLDKSLSLHAGFWDETTKTLPQALARENEKLAQMAHIKESDHVLDSGCGVGGSSIYLAKTFGCRVTGITLSEKQKEKAFREAELANCFPRPRFFVMDYLHTNFPDASFDVIWAIESVCHASCKKKFVTEAFRLLRPGGRLVVADGFVFSDSDNEKLKWLNGWGVSRLESQEAFNAHLVDAGFSNIFFDDVTNLVLPSSKKLCRLAKPAWIGSKIGQWLGIRNPVQTANIQSAYYQYRSLKKKLWLYAIFSAVKT